MSELDRALQILREHKDAFAEQFGVTKLGIFGSVARGESTDESDVDVVVEMSKPDGYALVHVRETLEEAIGKHVDIVRFREHMNPYLKKRIERDAVYV